MAGGGTTARGPGSSGTRRGFWLALAAFFLIGAAWASALPANGSYDEKDHIVRAYAVATGHLRSDHTVTDRRRDVTAAFLVPASLLPDQASVDCTWSPRPPRTADCQHWTTARTQLPRPSGAARYSPVYYLPVGLPLVLFPDLTGIVLARLLSALLSAVLLAAAVTAALRLGSRLLIVAVALAGTPMAMNLNGSVNPNGLEISAGILVFCVLLALLRAPADRLPDGAVRRLLLLLGIGSFLLLTVRQMGPVLLALDVLGCLPLARAGRLAMLWRRRDTRWIIGFCWVVGLVAAVGWLGYSRIADIAANTRDAQHLPLGTELGRIATGRVPFYLRQIVGEFGYGETQMPRFGRAAWYLLLAGLAVPCLAFARRRFSVVTFTLGLLSIGLLAALEVHFLPLIGWFSQGRYAMATLVGTVLVPASALGFERRLISRGIAVGYATALTAAAGLLHLYALVRVMARYQRGIDAGLDPFGGSWRPPVGSLVPLLALVAGVAALVTLVASARTRAVPPAPVEPG